MNQEDPQIELDIYYQGSLNQLYSFIYPLTGPSSFIFNHLELKNAKLDTKSKQIQFTYQPNCKNIDRQVQTFKYKSSKIQSASNYFYSTYQPQNKALIWRNITNLVQMRPQKSQQKTNSTKNEQHDIDIKVVSAQQKNNIALQQISQTTKQKIQTNWQMQKNQYLQYLSN